MTRRIERWTMIDFKDNGAFVCLRCDARYRPALPCPLNVWLAIGSAFNKDHGRCPPKGKT